MPPERLAHPVPRREVRLPGAALEDVAGEHAPQPSLAGRDLRHFQPAGMSAPWDESGGLGPRRGQTASDGVIEMSAHAPEVQRAPTKPPLVEGPKPPTRTRGRNLWVVAAIVASVAGLVGGYFLRWGTEPTKTPTTTVTETVAPPATSTEGAPLDPGGNVWPEVLGVSRLADHPNDYVLAPDPTVARVDRFIAAFNGDERPISPWSADSDLWSWNPYMTPGLAGSDANFASREGPVVKADDYVAFRVEYGTKGKGFGATWVQEWSPAKDVVERMWVLP